MKNIFNRNNSSSVNVLRLFLIALLFSFYLTEATSQDTTLFLTEKFQNYQQNSLTEKIFVHTDRGSYLAGETIFLKLYAVDGFFNKPLNVSQVVYVEMLDSANQPVLQTKIKLSGGLGNGAAEIPANLPSATYRLVAYTSWMRNFDPAYFFRKDISVINAQTEYEQKNTTAASRTINAQFFPEGGNMVQGLPGKVAFQVTNENGIGIHFNGAIVNQNKDTLLRFSPNIFGIGNFLFTPGKDRYTAIIQTDGSTTQHPLPAVFEKGFTMSVDASENNALKITVRSSTPEQFGKPVYLFAHTRGAQTTSMKKEMPANGVVTFTIEQDQLGEGISHFTIFEKGLKPVCERLYFKHPNVLPITANTNKSIYRTRENVNFGLQTNSKASLSLSIYKVDELHPVEELNIVNYLLLSSELKGQIQNPEYYFNASDKAVAIAVDNLMLTHGWRRFKWEDVSRSIYPVIQYNPDVEGVTVRAKVTDSLGNTLPNANAFMSVVSKHLQFYAGMTNMRGIVQFYTTDFYGKNEVVIHPFGKAMRYQVSLLSPFADNHATLPPSLSGIKTDNFDLLTSNSIHAQVQRAFSSSNPVRQGAIDSIPFFGPADKVYRLNDYTRLPTVGEALKEFIPEVIVRKKNKKAQLFVLDKTRQLFFESEPLILIDGVPVFDTDFIVSSSPSQIKTIELLNEKFFYGPFILNGIISFRTQQGDLGGFKLPREAFVFDYEGLQVGKEFYQPTYSENSSKRTPDFRHLLLWEPNVKVDAAGKSEISFSTSDVKGKFVAIVQGVSEDGSVGAKTISFEVRDPNR